MLVFICFVNKQLKLLSPVAVTVTNYFFEKSNCNLVFSHDFTYARDFFAEMWLKYVLSLYGSVAQEL